MWRYFILILLSLVWLNGHSQRYIFENLKVEDGLPQSQVTGVAQDSSGCLWVTSLGGVSRFDSKEFLNYAVDDGLLTNFCTAVVVDKSNHVWIGSQLGLSLFDGKRFTNFRLAGKQRSSLVSSLVAGDGPSQVFCVYDKKLYEFRDFRFSQITVDGHLNVSAVGRSAEGAVLAAVPSRGIYMLKGHQWILMVDQQKLGGGSYLN